MRCGRLGWFGHPESEGVDDWESISRDVVVAGVRCVGRKNQESVKDDTRLLGLQPEQAVLFRVVRRDFINGANV